jgi:dihydropyrimidinase
MTETLTSEIVRKVACLKSLLLVHAEDHVECSNMMKKMMLQNLNTDKNFLEMWSNARPTSSEVSSISKITKMASESGTNLYFAHIGSSEALQNVVKSRDVYQNINIWAETCPHYLTHSFEYNSLKGKVVPPIRSKLDVAVIWNAIQQGLIDTIGSDHVASTLKRKVVDGDLWKTLSGFPGLATLLPVMLSEGVNRKRISLERLSEICSYNPARIFKVYPKKGTIQCESDADLTIIDINKEKVVTPEDLQSSSDYTIYEGWKLRGWPIMTIIRGKPVMENGDVDIQAKGHGQFVTAVDCELN